MDRKDVLDAYEYAGALADELFDAAHATSGAAEAEAIAEAHRHFAQVALSMGYTVTKREPLPSIVETLGDV